MTNTYIFQIKLKTILKKFSFNWKSKNTSLKDMEKYYISISWKTLFFLNLMTFSKSRHSLDVCITAASPFMRMLLHFCEWLSSFIWLDTAGKWHNEKGKWKSFFFFSWKTKKYINHIQTGALFQLLVSLHKLHILLQIVFSTVLWITESVVYFTFKSLLMMCGFPKYYLDNYKFCIFK